MSVAAVREARAQSPDELYKKAAQEGVVNFYGTLAQINAEKILPVFEKRYSGVKVSQLDVTSDQLVTRATTEELELTSSPGMNRAVSGCATMWP